MCITHVPDQSCWWPQRISNIKFGLIWLYELEFCSVLLLWSFDLHTLLLHMVGYEDRKGMCLINFLMEALFLRILLLIFFITSTKSHSIFFANLGPGAAWCIWGPKVKIDYLILNAKLILINMNYIKFFLFLEIL